MKLDLKAGTLLGVPLNDLLDLGPNDTAEAIVAKGERVAARITELSGIQPFVEDSGPHEHECTWRGLLVFHAMYFSVGGITRRSFRIRIFENHMCEQSEYGKLSVDPELPLGFQQKDLTAALDARGIEWRLGDSRDLVLVENGDVLIAIAFDRKMFQSIEIRKDFSEGLPEA